jgi:hypothetical protein
MKKILLLLLSIVIISFQSCKKAENPTEPEEEITNGNIKTGTSVDVLTQTIGIDGGTIKVIKPSNPLNGLEFTIPANSFTQSLSVNISYAEIKGHEYGENFNPISPLINIQLNQSFSSAPMQLKIPIKLPAGYHAMAFLYNKNTGELEGLPTEELTSSYIIVNSSHFSYTTANKRTDEITDENNQVIVASTLETLTSGNLQIAAGFDVGLDDWEFPNYGSYIAPGGHCAGQSASAIWYYAEKRTSLGRLFHKFDTNCDPAQPSLYWYDNPKGYRLCSVIQTEMNWGYWWTKWDNKVKKQMEKPGLIWKNILIALIVKKQPQLLFIRESATGAAHAIICYKIDLTEQMLYIADPNFPNNKIQRMKYSDSWIGPYVSRDNAGSPNRTFDQFGYFQISQFIELKKIRDRWKEFENGTIGNDKFPSYKLYSGSTSGSEITDGMKVTNSKLEVVCKSTTCGSSISGTDNLQNIEIYNDQGILVSAGNSTNKGIATYQINKGANKIGICVNGLRSDNKEYFIDFKWVTINYEATAQNLVINPATLDAALNGTYDFKAEYKGGVLPSKYKCYWLIPGETSYISKENDLSLRYQFKKEGTFRINLSLYDISTSSSNLLGSAETNVIVTKKPMSDLYGKQSISVSVFAECEYSNYNSKVIDVTAGFSSTTYGGPKILTWTNNSFGSNYSYYKLGAVAGDTTFVTGSVTGEISDDGKTIVSLKLSESVKNNRSPGKYDFSVEIKNLAIQRNDYPSGYNVSGSLKGSAIGAAISSMSYKATFYDSDTDTWKEVTLSNINYGSANIPALMAVVFQ